ncbi:MAG: PilZ domain-containing protein [Deltaproteobacteria bacterium]|nr:PilZ domain-containing protein [Deltaproteobacteria bacterium]
MTIFPFRPTRQEAEHKVRICLQESKSGENLPGSCSGVMVDISQEGVCLVLPQMLLEGKHLFFATLNSDKYHLALMIDNPASDDDEVISVSARSVWMDACQYKKEPAFKMGLCFHDRQKGLFKLFRK